jgi:type II secretory pathway pseudopilin PulG
MELKKLFLLKKQAELLVSKTMRKRFKNKGFGIIEILVSISLAAIVLTAFLNLTWQTVKINQANIKELRARMYLKELIEIAKDLEKSESGWNLITSCSPLCYPYDSGSTWALNLSGEKEKLENNTYERWLSVIDVDQDVKKVVGEIEWHDGFKDRTAKLETYIYNYNF